MVPRILYWRNASREADWLVKALASPDTGGKLCAVDSKRNFERELRGSRTDFIVTHEELLSVPLLKTIQERCPRAGLLLLCKDEKIVDASLRDTATHLLCVERITEALPTVKSAIRHSSRMFKSPLTDMERSIDADAVLNLVSDAVIVESPEHTITRWNAAAERLFGWPAVSVLGRERKDIVVHVEKAVEVEARKALELNGNWSGEVLYTTAQSRQIDVLSQRRKLETGGWIEVCSDVSDLRFGDRKAKLLTSTHLLLSAQPKSIEKTLDTFAKMAVPLLADTCVIDLKGEDDAIRRVGFASRIPALAAVEAALKDELPMFLATRVTAGNVLRSNKREILHNAKDPADFLGVQDTVARSAIQQCTPVTILTVPIFCMGKVRALLSLAAGSSNRILETEGGMMLQEFAAVLGSAIERAYLEQRLRIESAQSNQANIYKDAFLGTISHELRTPLQAMLGWTQLLRDPSLSREAVTKALDSLERSIKAQGQIISDLLDLSRISAGRLELDARPCELLPIVAAAIRSCEVQAKLKGVEIEPIDTKDTPVWVAADLNWLQRAFYNLVSNAVKFTTGGGKVSVAIESDSMSVQISITDTGKGINNSYLPFVFERFSQAETGTTRMHGGLGVGLSIVRHVVESHGGTVEAKSRGEGQGSCFVVSLPICPPPAETADANEDPPAGGDRSLVGVRVLLVEDESDTRELLRFVLEQNGATVTEAATAVDALRCVQQGSYNVLVSDIGLPEEDGYSLIRRVRQLPANRGSGIAALALTAYARAEDRVNALRAGFNVHVCKPVEPSELILMVAELSKRSVSS